MHKLLWCVGRFLSLSSFHIIIIINLNLGLESNKIVTKEIQFTLFRFFIFSVKLTVWTKRTTSLSIHFNKEETIWFFSYFTPNQKWRNGSFELSGLYAIKWTVPVSLSILCSCFVSFHIASCRVGSCNYVSKSERMNFNNNWTIKKSFGIPRTNRYEIESNYNCP